MAVDSRDRRFSILSHSSPVVRVLPDPDGSVGTQDRAHFAMLYSGIALETLTSSVDTRDKRFSLLCHSSPFLRVLPNPDGTVDTQDRAHFAMLYSGIALDNPSAPTFVAAWASQSTTVVGVTLS